MIQLHPDQGEVMPLEGRPMNTLAMSSVLIIFHSHSAGRVSAYMRMRRLPALPASIWVRRSDLHLLSGSLHCSNLSNRTKSMKIILLVTAAFLSLAHARVRPMYCDYGYDGVAGCAAGKYAYCVRAAITECSHPLELSDESYSAGTG
jgi:hypothetical protein